MQAVIYAFRSPGSGAVYIGKHQCCPDGWPRRGTGPLPDGYRGSGVAVANFHRRHGAAVQWRILATVAGGRDAVNAAERRAIRLARALFGRACVNRTQGGDGFTSDDARALWSDPGVKVKICVGLGKARARPDVKLRMSIGAERANARPEVKARRSTANKEAQNRPEAKAMRSAQGKARIQTPEGAAVLARAQVVAAQKRRARKDLAPFRRSPALRHPGLILWAYIPRLPLGIAGPGIL